jgi:hypothetical protein
MESGDFSLQNAVYLNIYVHVKYGKPPYGALGLFSIQKLQVGQLGRSALVLQREIINP